MKTRRTKKSTAVTFTCHFVTNNRTLCGSPPDMFDTASRYDFQSHANACPSCRGRLASFDAVETSARTLSSVGFPIDGDTLRAIRKGDLDGALSSARNMLETIDRVAKMNAVDGILPRWYDEAKNAALAFRSAVMSLA